LHECGREYDAVSASTRRAVDVAVTCLAAAPSYLPPDAGRGLPTWPPPSTSCTPAAVPPALLANDSWFHGGCQQYTGAAAGAMMSDPAFPPCGVDAGEPECFFGDSWTATL
jgi:hypothetical protein